MSAEAVIVNDDELLSQSQVAKECKWSYFTVRAYLSNGKLAATKVGGIKYVRRGELNRYLASKGVFLKKGMSAGFGRAKALLGSPTGLAGMYDDTKVHATGFPNDCLPQAPGRNDYISDELMRRIQARISV